MTFKKLSLFKKLQKTTNFFQLFFEFLSVIGVKMGF